MDRLTEPTRTLLLMTAKINGNRNPVAALCLIEENLLVKDVRDVKGFLTWVSKDVEHRAYGYANIDARWLQFKESK